MDERWTPSFYGVGVESELADHQYFALEIARREIGEAVGVLEYAEVPQAASHLLGIFGSVGLRYADEDTQSGSNRADRLVADVN